MTSRLSFGSAALAVFVLGAPALAQSPEAPDFRMLWDVTGDSNGPTDYNWDDVNGEPGGYGSLNGFGEWSVPANESVWTGWNYDGLLTGSFDSGQDWVLEWNCIFNNDVDGAATGGGAFVTANIVVTNNDIFTQNFSLLMTLPVSRLIPDPGERGSVVGTVTDLTFDDATVFAPAGGQIYTPHIDGAVETPGLLMVDPFSQNAGGPLLSAEVGPEEFGVPSLVPATQDVDDSIAILLSFDLTAGDSASFTAIFEVLPNIPGPAALPLLAGGLLAAGRRRRR